MVELQPSKLATRVRFPPPAWRYTRSAERGDQCAIRRPRLRLRRKIPDRAGLTGEVRRELDAAMRSEPLRHVAHELRIVESPQAPLGECERLAGVRLVELLGACPRGARAPDVVEVVVNDVDVRVTGV